MTQQSQKDRPDRILGVVGGMGPLATVDFLSKLVRGTDVASDQEHVPVVLVSDPRVPDRTEALAEGRFEDVAEALLERMAKLEAAGADAVAIPCNSAHYWFDALRERCRLPIIHIADASVTDLRGKAAGGKPVTVWATPSTLAGGFYETRLKEGGFDYSPTPENLIREAVMPAIRKVKSGKLEAAREALAPVIDFAEKAGIGQAILACTELPLALQGVTCDRLGFVDTNEALAAACIRWWRTGELPSPNLERH